MPSEKELQKRQQRKANREAKNREAGKSSRLKKRGDKAAELKKAGLFMDMQEKTFNPKYPEFRDLVRKHDAKDRSHIFTGEPKSRPIQRRRHRHGTYKELEESRRKHGMQAGGRVGVRPDVAKLKREEGKQIAGALADKQKATAVKPYQYKHGGLVEQKLTKGVGAARPQIFYGPKD